MGMGMKKHWHEWGIWAWKSLGTKRSGMNSTDMKKFGHESVLIGMNKAGHESGRARIGLIGHEWGWARIGRHESVRHETAGTNKG